MNHFIVGTAKEEFLDKRSGLPMQGYADPRQKSSTAINGIYSRAFVIEDSTSGAIIAIAVAEIWACSRLLKNTILKKLRNAGIIRFNTENLMITGTHTHAAPGGYTGYRMYDQPSGEIDEDTLDCYATGISNSISAALNSAKPGKIYLSQGIVENCGAQRSKLAYDNNTKDNKKLLVGDTDKKLQILRLAQLGSNNGYTSVGTLSWYAIHPTFLGQENTIVSGDCFGKASNIVENEFFNGHPECIVAFANSNCGDVSGNVDVDVKKRTFSKDVKRMEKAGRILADSVTGILLSGEEIEPTGIEFWHREERMSDIKTAGKPITWPSALGLSFTVGSTEDSRSVYRDGGANYYTQSIFTELKEGITISNETALQGTQRRQMSSIMGYEFNTEKPIFLKEIVLNGHGGKPIVFAPQENLLLMPYELPLQLFRIGNFSILGFPGELTSLAGEILRRHVVEHFKPFVDKKVQNLALSCFANDYSQYTTTQEEYNMQHYEGASTLFGPNTLAAYQQQFISLDQPLDKRVICYNMEKWDTKFTLRYFDQKNIRITLTSKYPDGKHTFKLPWFANNISVVTTYPLFFGAFHGDTKPLSVEVEPDAGKFVEFHGGKKPFMVARKGNAKKFVRFYNHTIFAQDFSVSYYDGNGNYQRNTTGGMKYLAKGAFNDFSLPWNAERIQAHAGYVEFVGPWNYVEPLNLFIKSGEYIMISMINETVGMHIKSEGYA